jgi:hypothetical protein
MGGSGFVIRQFLYFALSELMLVVCDAGKLRGFGTRLHDRRGDFREARGALEAFCRILAWLCVVAAFIFVGMLKSQSMYLYNMLCVCVVGVGSA